MGDALGLLSAVVALKEDGAFTSQLLSAASTSIGIVTGVNTISLATTAEEIGVESAKTGVQGLAGILSTIAKVEPSVIISTVSAAASQISKANASVRFIGAINTDKPSFPKEEKEKEKTGAKKKGDLK